MARAQPQFLLACVSKRCVKREQKYKQLLWNTPHYLSILRTSQSYPLQVVAMYNDTPIEWEAGEDREIEVCLCMCKTHLSVNHSRLQRSSYRCRKGAASAAPALPKQQRLGCTAFMQGCAKRSQNTSE